MNLCCPKFYVHVLLGFIQPCNFVLSRVISAKQSLLNLSQSFRTKSDISKAYLGLSCYLLIPLSQSLLKKKKHQWYSRRYTCGII